jgi:hypothetical protein
LANTNRPSVIARNTGVMAGIDKHITGPVIIGGITYTPATLKAVFSDENAAITATEALHTQVTDQVQATNQARAKGSLTYQLLRSFLIGQYGKQANAVLGDFGMEAPKSTGATTLKSKTAAATKRAATRQVRNTMGSVQKLSHTGVMEVPVMAVTTIVPVTAPTTGAAPAAGAASPAPATPAAAPPVVKPTT